MPGFPNNSQIPQESLVRRHKLFLPSSSFVLHSTPCLLPCLPPHPPPPPTHTPVCPSSFLASSFLFPLLRCGLPCPQRAPLTSEWRQLVGKAGPSGSMAGRQGQDRRLDGTRPSMYQAGKQTARPRPPLISYSLPSIQKPGFCLGTGQRRVPLGETEPV